MELNPEILANYARGQVEIQNPTEGYLYRGEVDTIEIRADELHVIFEWVARGQGYPPLPTGWVMDDQVVYNLPLIGSQVTNVGPNPEGGGDRIQITSSVIGEIVILFPNDGGKLDISQVKAV